MIVEDLIEVEKIITHRLKDEKIEYQIKLCGYDKLEWVKIDYFESGQKNLTDDYHKKNLLDSYGQSIAKVKLKNEKISKKFKSATLNKLKKLPIIKKEAMISESEMIIPEKKCDVEVTLPLLTRRSHVLESIESSKSSTITTISSKSNVDNVLSAQPIINKEETNKTRKESSRKRGQSLQRSQLENEIEQVKEINDKSVLGNAGMKKSTPVSTIKPIFIQSDLSPPIKRIKLNKPVHISNDVPVSKKIWPCINASPTIEYLTNIIAQNEGQEYDKIVKSHHRDIVAKMVKENPGLLVLSASNNNVKIGNSLLCLGADINENDSSGTTPLMVAFNKEYEAIIELLIKKGVDINIDTNGRDFMLEKCITSNNVTIFKLLLTARPDYSNIEHLITDKTSSISIALEDHKKRILEHLDIKIRSFNEQFYKDIIELMSSNDDVKIIYPDQTTIPSSLKTNRLSRKMVLFSCVTPKSYTIDQIIEGQLGGAFDIHVANNEGQLVANYEGKRLVTLLQTNKTYYINEEDAAEWKFSLRPIKDPEQCAFICALELYKKKLTEIKSSTVKSKDYGYVYNPSEEDFKHRLSFIRRSLSLQEIRSRLLFIDVHLRQTISRRRSPVQLAILNYNGDVLLNTLVCPRERLQVSSSRGFNITDDDVRGQLDEEEASKVTRRLANSKILVGHDLNTVIEHLNIDKESLCGVRDLSSAPIIRKLTLDNDRFMRLSNITRNLSIDGALWYPKLTASTMLSIYKMVENEWEDDITLNSGRTKDDIKEVFSHSRNDNIFTVFSNMNDVQVTTKDTPGLFMEDVNSSLVTTNKCDKEDPKESNIERDESSVTDVLPNDIRPMNKDYQNKNKDSSEEPLLTGERINSSLNKVKDISKDKLNDKISDSNSKEERLESLRPYSTIDTCLMTEECKALININHDTNIASVNNEDIRICPRGTGDTIQYTPIKQYQRKDKKCDIEKNNTMSVSPMKICTKENRDESARNDNHTLRTRNIREGKKDIIKDICHIDHTKEDALSSEDKSMFSKNDITLLRENKAKSKENITDTERHRKELKNNIVEDKDFLTTSNKRKLHHEDTSLRNENMKDIYKEVKNIDPTNSSKLVSNNDKPVILAVSKNNSYSETKDSHERSRHKHRSSTHINNRSRSTSRVDKRARSRSPSFTRHWSRSRTNSRKRKRSRSTNTKNRIRNRSISGVKNKSISKTKIISSANDVDEKKRYHDNVFRDENKHKSRSSGHNNDKLETNKKENLQSQRDIPLRDSSCTRKRSKTYFVDTNERTIHCNKEDVKHVRNKYKSKDVTPIDDVICLDNRNSCRKNVAQSKEDFTTNHNKNNLHRNDRSRSKSFSKSKEDKCKSLSNKSSRNIISIKKVTANPSESKLNKEYIVLNERSKSICRTNNTQTSSKEKKSSVDNTLNDLKKKEHKNHNIDLGNNASRTKSKDVNKYDLLPNYLPSTDKRILRNKDPVDSNRSKSSDRNNHKAKGNDLPRCKDVERGANCYQLSCDTEVHNKSSKDKSVLSKNDKSSMNNNLIEENEVVENDRCNNIRSDRQSNIFSKINEIQVKYKNIPLNDVRKTYLLGSNSNMKDKEATTIKPHNMDRNDTHSKSKSPCNISESKIPINNIPFKDGHSNPLRMTIPSLESTVRKDSRK